MPSSTPVQVQTGPLMTGGEKKKTVTGGALGINELQIEVELRG